jgi:hypothetical protein
MKLTAEQIYTIPFRNDSEAEIPPFAVLKHAGNVVDRSGQWVASVTKPDTTFSRLYLINGPVAIPDGAYGLAADGSYPVLVKTETDTPASETGWGVTAGSWALRKNRPGNFSCLGPSKTDVGLFRQEECNSIIGQLTGSLAAGGTATVNLCYGDPATTEGTIQATVRDKLLISGSLPNDTILAAEWINGVWYLKWWTGPCAS